MGLFKRMLPTISKTEQEALDAGDVWIEGEVFSGKPNWDLMLRKPALTLSEKEQSFLDNETNELCERVDDWKVVSEDNDLPEEAWDYIKEKKFFGMIIPEYYGGLGFSPYAHSEIISKLSSRSATLAVTVMVPNSLGPAELLMRYGTEEQKEHYLPRLADGTEVPCFALTSPEAGSDAAGSMVDNGKIVRLDDGSVGIELSWNKRYITLAPIATLLGLAFKLSDPDHILGDEKDLGITLALIPTNHPGVEVGPRHDPMGVPFLNGPTRGNNVQIPLSMIIGGESWIGNGWQMLMDCLSEGRSISLPALSVGSSKAACAIASAYTTVRRQFKIPVSKFEGVSEVLGRMAAQTYAMNATKKLTLNAVSAHCKPSVVSALTKYQLTERMRQNVNDAMDIVGGVAICQGPSNLLSGMYKAIPIGITVEGANILTRTLITYGQGLTRAHPYVLGELKAIENNSLIDFDKAFTGHILHTTANGFRTVWGGLFSWVHSNSNITSYFPHLTRISSIFALTSDFLLMLLGGSLKRSETISGKMADVLSEVYISVAVFKEYGETLSPQEKQFVHWNMQTCLYRAQESLIDVFDNFPVKSVGKFLKFISFPFGRSYAKPSNELTHQIAEEVCKNSSTRNIIIEGIFKSKKEKDAYHKLELAFEFYHSAKEIEREFKEYLHDTVSIDEKIRMVNRLEREGKILPHKVNTLKSFYKLQKDVIQVDEFQEE